MAYVDQDLVVILMGGMFLAGILVGLGLVLLIWTLNVSRKTNRDTETTDASKEQDN